MLGADFFVMERRRGEVVREGLPETMRAHPDVGRRIAFALVDAMADLHALDPSACGLADLGRPEGFVERQVSGWAKRWALSKFEDSPTAMDEIHQRLVGRLPAMSRVSIVHNDLKLDNCQFDPADPDRVVSIFDWDMTTLGDPLVDLGTLLNYWPDPDDSEATSRGTRPGLARMGLPPARRDRRALRREERRRCGGGPLVGGVRAVEDRRGGPAASPPLGARGKHRSPHGPDRRPHPVHDRRRPRRPRPRRTLNHPAACPWESVGEDLS